jgi:hypothetical protein
VDRSGVSVVAAVAGEGGARTGSDVFASFFAGESECSAHRRREGRLDLIAATAHDAHVADDHYQRLLAHRMRTARDGLRWHLIETAPGQYGSKGRR